MKSMIVGLVAGSVFFCGTLRCVAQMRVDADYPGGNIRVMRIAGDTISLRPSIRDTQGWWFWWNFRVSGAAGRTLTFSFRKTPIGNRGPAISLDDGQTWSWLGGGAVRGRSSFSYSFAPDAGSVRFAFAIPYQEADLKRFLAQYKGNKHLAIHELCKTRKGRSVERIHIGRLDGQPQHRVLITCRHHACECTASYVLEGILAALLAETEDGKWFRGNVEVLAIPFVDKDGVEDGDQGKNRKPRDHCRDYEGESLYPSVATIRTLVPKWSGGRLRIALDLHSPWFKSQTIYVVGSAHERIRNEQCKFNKMIEVIDDKALPFEASDYVPFGTSWNTAKNYQAGKSFFQWADELEGINLSAAMEIPYANAYDATITPEAGRAFGANLAQAMRQYIAQL